MPDQRQVIVVGIRLQFLQFTDDEQDIGFAAPDNVGVTTAVNLTALPEGDGFADDDRLVAVMEVIEKLADSLPSTLPATSVL